MADGSAALRAQVARLRALPKALTRDAAPRIAKAVEAEIRAQVAKGVGPDGRPWQPRKDGGRPLVHAAEAVSVRAVGDTIIVTIEGVEARHHLGAVRGGVKREVIPTGALPDPVATAIQRVVEREFLEAMGAS